MCLQRSFNGQLNKFHLHLFRINLGAFSWILQLTERERDRDLDRKSEREREMEYRSMGFGRMRAFRSWWNCVFYLCLWLFLSICAPIGGLRLLILPLYLSIPLDPFHYSFSLPPYLLSDLFNALALYVNRSELTPSESMRKTAQTNVAGDLIWMVMVCLTLPSMSHCLIISRRLPLQFDIE